MCALEKREEGQPRLCLSFFTSLHAIGTRDVLDAVYVTSVCFGASASCFVALRILIHDEGGHAIKAVKMSAGAEGECCGRNGRKLKVLAPVIDMLNHRQHAKSAMVLPPKYTRTSCSPHTHVLHATYQSSERRVCHI